MIEGIFVAISLGIMLAFTIGPVFFILIETSITKGIRSALAFDLGAISGDIFFILLAYWGTSKLSAYIENNPNLFLYGGLLIIIYGLFSYLKERKDFRKHPPQMHITTLEDKNYFTLFYKGFLLNIINVGVFAYWLATIAAFSSREGITPTEVLIFLGTILSTYLIVDIIKILIAKRLRHKLTPTNIHKIKQGINLFLVGFGIFLALSGIFPNFLHSVKALF
ncbi:LysE family transporter [uncultured Capnocytophaga sp.]|jgi:lysine exporter protein|uniref:LysE family translocator n=1 Tax=uncultured Capnocytophaga sp. TaxID=159273 RepID=UPI00262E428E|nr:LysE family transporter [uncultured Capnocytophaga sp.]